MSKTETTRVPAIEAMISGNVLELTFANGERLSIDASQLTPDIAAQAMMHGLKQKLVDAAAISRNPDTGRSATVDDKFTAVREVFDRLIAGEWNKRREGGGASGGGLLLSALVRLYSGRKTEQQLREYVTGLTEKEQATLRASERIAPIIAAIKAERDARVAAGAGRSGDDLLAELDGTENGEAPL